MQKTQQARRRPLRRPPALVGLAAALVLGLAANASAATIGQVGGDTACGGNFVIADANASYKVPATGGRITSFSVATTVGAAGQQLDFLVLRPAGGSYTVVGKTGLVTLAGTGGTETFPANITVKAGDVIGEFLSNGDGRFNCLRSGSPSSDMENAQDDPNVGDTVTFSVSSGLFDVNEAATLVTTGLALGCAPATVAVGHPTTCTATYTGSTHPTGTVTFATNASGSFSSRTCTLVLIGGNQARCSVTYTPNAIPPTTHTIYANYSGDVFNPPAHTSTTVTVHL